ncbi:hypothetical protein B0O99DRAFT_683169 [Bisporella sp. PMI_857]|nr:hypothetical protein B0O99DRAFT_683169 [Bisporella sp. PMI_857]
MELAKWFCAFDPLWRALKHSPPPVSKEFFQATLMSLQATSTCISVQGSVYRRETDWDIHVPEFNEIVSLTEKYLYSKPKRFYFAFEGETIIYLYYVLLKCRDGAIRRRALMGLDEHPRRECSWDTAHSASVGRWAMSQEEGQRGNVKCHEIIEEDRVRLLGTEYDTVKGQIRTWAYQLRNGERVYLNHQWP